MTQSFDSVRADTEAPSQPDAETERRATRFFWILTAGAAGMAALLALLPAAGHDQLWFLLMARRRLAGATLYGPQAFDSNPPGIVWLSAVPVWLGAACHVPATFFAKLLATLLESACALLSFKLLPLAWRPVRRHEAVALLFAALVLWNAVPARDFGQRDHLVGFLLLPYVLSAAIDALRLPLRSLRIAAGVLAAGAICLKPHHALVPIAVESALLLGAGWATARSSNGDPRDSVILSEAPQGRSRRIPAFRGAPLKHGVARNLLRPEPLLILLLGALYLLAIRRFAPLYFTSALPITRSVYWAIGHLTLPQLLWEAIELCLLAAIAIWLFVRQRSSTPAVRLLLLAGAASFAAYLLQGTGWYYQQLPAISFFGIALALELLDVARPKPLHISPWLPKAAAALTILALALTTHFTGYPFTRDRAFAIDSPDPAFFTPLAPGTPVAILTTSVDEAMMPVERYHLTWAQRTNNLWFLPAILRAEQSQTGRLRPTQLADLEALQHHWMVEDLTRWQPRLILIERCQYPAVRCQELEDRHDDLLAWFQRDPDFAALWRQHYSFAATHDRFDAYKRTR